MICNLIEISKDVVTLYLFEGFQLRYEFPVVVGQTHAIGGFLQVERLHDDSGVTNDSQIINGKTSGLYQTLPNGKNFSNVVGFLTQPPGKIENNFP